MKNLSVNFVIAVLLFVLPNPASSDPEIDSTTGSFIHKNRMTINGSGFGSKEPAKPYLWAPFDDGSLNPSPLGTITAWDAMENIGYNSHEGVGGSGCAKASNSSGVWTLGVRAGDFAWNDLGQQMYLFRKIKINFSITASLNWKNWRLWALRNTDPNIHISTSNGSMTVEHIDNPSGYMHDVDAGRGQTNAYNTEEIIMQSNSSLTVKDGLFWFIVNGVEAGHLPYEDYSKKTLQLISQDHQTGMILNYPVHGVKANATLPDNYRYWADDVYLDRTWARVMIGDAAIWSECTKKEPQIPSQWSNSNIQIIVNTGAFAPDQVVYLYVVSEDGVANNQGREIIIEGDGDTSPPSPPTGLVVGMIASYIVERG